MNHTHVQRRLLLFLDGTLLISERLDIEQHLDGCAVCSKKLERLARIWTNEELVTRLEPSPNLTTRVSARIRGYEADRYLLADVLDHIRQTSRPAAALLLIVAGLLLGVRLGNVPASSNGQVADNSSSVPGREGFFSEGYLDSFRDLPPESIGGVYFALARAGQGGVK